METPIERHRRLLPYFERFKTNIVERIGELNEEMDAFEIDPGDYTSQYEDMLDEVYDPIIIGGAQYYVSHVLKQIDGPAYNQGLVEYVDRIDKDTIPEYQSLAEEHESLTDTLADVEEYIELAVELLEEYADPETTDAERLLIVERLDAAEPVEPRSADPAHDLLPA